MVKISAKAGPHLQLSQLGRQSGELLALGRRQLREHLCPQLRPQLGHARANAFHARGNVGQSLLLLLQRLACLGGALFQLGQICARLPDRLPDAQRRTDQVSPPNICNVKRLPYRLSEAQSMLTR